MLYEEKSLFLIHLQFIWLVVLHIDKTTPWGPIMSHYTLSNGSRVHEPIYSTRSQIFVRPQKPAILLKWVD